MTPIADIDTELDAVAVIGMSGRFPGAGSVHELWCNLRDGLESIRFFSDEQLLEAGVDPVTLADPRYVKAKGMLDDADCFDAALFGYTPRETLCIDPQHRLFLECAWSALEDAGYVGESYDGLVGVYAGCSANTYFLSNLGSPVFQSMGGLNLLLNNDKDALTMRVSYKLDLKGPSITVQTACSTSLVAVAQACQNLLAYQCDVALAGGVCVHAPRARGYMYQEDGIASPDGHCRAFDALAQGTVAGEGVGIVVLKRLHEALADGDRILAVIKGWAINNDGRHKVGYTAPSIQGQAEAIAAAHAFSGITADSVSYVETHGTGTALGDPVEIEALTQAFRATTQERQFCAIGSVKTNLGHLDAAAGVTGLIKTVLSVQHAELPPSLHFESPNPALELESSPFYVNATLRPWPRTPGPRRAGVSSFGMGGTNAHVVVESAPVCEPSEPARPHELLLLSAGSAGALDRMASDLAARLRADGDLNLADVAYTLQTGRRRLAHGLALVCGDVSQAVQALETRDPALVSTVVQKAQQRGVAFMFPGQGTQYPNMGHGLYRDEAAFRDAVDTCCEQLKPHLDLDLDLRTVMFPRGAQSQDAAERLKQTWLTQPALFVIEYSLAQLWISWGVKPQAMLGHSIGEYVAACLAGVWGLDDALELVAARGRMMHEQPPGAMLAVVLPAEDLEPTLDGDLSLALINEPGMSVASGPTEQVQALEALLSARGVASRRLHTSHAFHSAMMDPVLEPFGRLVQRTTMQSPSLPFVSNLSGDWITAEEATDPGYWVRHLRGTVRFADGVARLLDAGSPVLLEVGPGNTLSTMATRHPQRAREHAVVASMRHPQEDSPDRARLLSGLGRLWQAGVDVDWHAVHGKRRRCRVSLPTYPFERKRYWLDHHEPTERRRGRSAHPVKNPDVSRWIYVPGWRTRPLSGSTREGPITWLVLADEHGIAGHLATRMRQRGDTVILARRGPAFARDNAGDYVMRCNSPADYAELLSNLQVRDGQTLAVVHLWSLSRTALDAETPETPLDAALEAGFYSLLELARSLPEGETASTRITVVTRGLQRVTGEESLCADAAPVLGLCRVLPQELEGLRCTGVDVQLQAGNGWQSSVADWLADESLAGCPDRIVAYRGGRRWVQTFESTSAPDGRTPAPKRETYLITGGLGNVGLTLARHLATRAGTKLALTTRRELPPSREWEALLARGTDDETSRRIRALQDLESSGAEVMVLPVDLAAPEQVNAMVAKVLERWGAVDVLVHAAGGIRETGIHGIREIDRDRCEQQLVPKVLGTLNLEAALAQAPPCLAVLMSSLSTVLGGIGFGAYAAANAYMDAFAQQRHAQTGTRWRSLNWDGWWLAPGDPRSQASPAARLAMTGEEGVQAFDHALAVDGEPQLMVSTGDLELRLEHATRLEEAATEVGPEPGTAGLEEERPELEQEYVAPRDDTERAVAGTWAEMLGMEQIGIHDNFYELGGHSLLALQIVARLSEQLGLTVTVGEMLKCPTVAQLASVCRSASDTDREQAQRVDEVAESVDALSEEEIDRLLGEKEDPQAGALRAR